MGKYFFHSSAIEPWRLCLYSFNANTDLDGVHLAGPLPWDGIGSATSVQQDIKFLQPLVIFLAMFYCC